MARTPSYEFDTRVVRDAEMRVYGESRATDDSYIDEARDVILDIFAKIGCTVDGFPVVESDEALELFELAARVAHTIFRARPSDVHYLHTRRSITWKELTLENLYSVPDLAFEALEMRLSAAPREPGTPHSHVRFAVTRGEVRGALGAPIDLEATSPLVIYSRFGPDHGAFDWHDPTEFASDIVRASLAGRDACQRPSMAGTITRDYYSIPVEIAPVLLGLIAMSAEGDDDGSSLTEVEVRTAIDRARRGVTLQEEREQALTRALE